MDNPTVMLVGQDGSKRPSSHRDDLRAAQGGHLHQEHEVDLFDASSDLLTPNAAVGPFGISGPSASHAADILSATGGVNGLARGSID